MGKEIDLVVAIILLFLSAGAWASRNQWGESRIWGRIWKVCIIVGSIYLFLSALLGLGMYFGFFK